MLKDITIGQYIAGNSVIHRLDPRMKIIFTIAYLILVLTANTFASYMLIAAYTITVTLISLVPLKILIKGLKPMLWIFIFTAIVNLFSVPGKTLIAFSVFKITDAGVVKAISVSARLIFLIVGASLLTLTTPPLTLTDGIERLLSPLRKLKIPTSELAMMMSIAIRFIPTLADEAEKIKKAQLARGADFESGNITDRAKSLIPIIVPLFIGAFRRADVLAEAMDARCYRGGNRTRLNELHITGFDIRAAVIFSICAIILIITEFAIEF